ncbi:phage BR0599 family protein, partial [Lutimaribacter sp. EGI FJ00014]|nr:phage BR0599 family protein [Lutimaribacter sp. EGI FJ00014]
QIARRDGRFVAELESPERALDQTNGRTLRRGCDAELGDERCGVDLEAGGFKGNGVLDAVKGNSIVVSGLDTFETGWFTNGIVTWASGASAGRRERVAAHRKGVDGVVLDLWRDTAATVAPGDALTVVAGCDKRFSTCKAKFANSANFRGFPHLPGDDAAYGYVTEEQTFDGGPLVE